MSIVTVIFAIVALLKALAYCINAISRLISVIKQKNKAK